MPTEKQKLEAEDLIDIIELARDEYRIKRRESLDQVEMCASLAYTSDLSMHSSDAERYGAALHALNLVLTRCRAALEAAEKEK